MQVVILAGGLGKRLRPLTDRIPKVMVPILGQPFLKYQIDLLRHHGFTDMIICVGHLGEKIIEYFGDGRRFGVKIRYSVEKSGLLGTAGAIKNAESLLEEVFFVTYGDAYLIVDYRSVLDYFERFDKLGLMVVYKNCGRYDKSNVEVEGDLVKVYSKKERIPGMFYIDFGVSLVRKKALSLMRRGEVVDLEEFYRKLIRRKELLAFETSQRFYEIGSKAGLGEFQALVSSGRFF